MQKHREQYTARYNEMGIDKHMRLQCLCNYLEEAAGVHAMSLGVGTDRLAGDGLAWVMTKLRLRLLGPLPKAGETFTVETWPVTIERVQFRRDFMVADPSGRPLAAAVTQWVVINLEKRKVERLPFYIAELQPENPEFALEDADIRIPLPADPVPASPSFPVRLADIDQNRHVNNGRYIDFILEAAHAAGMRGTLRQMDLVFRAEGLLGDTIGTATGVEEESGLIQLTHCLFRQKDGQELTRGRTLWVDSLPLLP